MAQNTLRRYLTAAGIAAAIAAGGYFAWSRDAAEHASGYETETVDRGSIVAAVTATGTVNPVTTVKVGTYVSGPIRAIDVDYNSPVRRGQRVAKIDPAPFQVKVQRADANLATARAKVLKARADLALKKLTLDRNRQLRTRNLIAQNDLDTAQSQYDQAAAQVALDEAGVKQAQAELEEAHINLAYTDITSPVDGVVVSRSVDVGQTVAASFQTPTLFEIAQDLTKMQVNTNVSESDIGAVREGQPAVFSVDAYRGREFRGIVVQVRNAPITVQNVVTYDVVVAVDNRSLEIKPGMTATVTITTAQRDEIVRIPVRALRFNPERQPAGAQTPVAPSGAGPGPAPAVWLVEADGTGRRIAVETGLRNDQYAEVVSGDVQPGDRVAVALRRETPRPTARPPGLAGRWR